MPPVRLRCALCAVRHLATPATTIVFAIKPESLLYYSLPMSIDRHGSPRAGLEEVRSSKASVQPTQMHRFRRILVGLSLAFGVVSLGGVPACGGPAKPALRPLAAYSGRVASLFDDAIEPSAVGITGDRGLYQPKYDPLFRERAQTADAVIRIKVVTIVAKGETRGTSYVIGCKSEKKLAGSHPPEEQFELRAASDAPSVGILKNLDSAIVGKRFIAFVRSFVRPDGDTEIHFHLAPDTKEVSDAATDATTILDGPAKF